MTQTTIQSVSDLIGQVLTLDFEDDYSVFYRGHSSEKFVNKPGVFRSSDLRKNEDRMFRELISLHPEEFHSDRTALEQLVRAQHYGLPTRLLDITKNPLAALYFVCSDNSSVNGEIVIFLIGNARVKRYDSDTVSCLANLAFLSGLEKTKLKRRILKMQKDRKLTDHDEIQEFRNSKEIQRLYHFICQEKPYFKNELIPREFGQHLAVLPKLSNRRISAQSGAFIVFGILDHLIEGSSPFFDIKRLSVPYLVKEQILEELNLLDVNEHTLFPEIEHSANFIKRHHT